MGGKRGITDGVIAHVEELLSSDELVKLRWGGDRAGLDAGAAALAQRCRAELVGLVGTSIVLYRRDAERPLVEVPDRPPAVG